MQGILSKCRNLSVGPHLRSHLHASAHSAQHCVACVLKVSQQVYEKATTKDGQSLGSVGTSACAQLGKFALRTHSGDRTLFLYHASDFIQPKLAAGMHISKHIMATSHCAV